MQALATCRGSPRELGDPRRRPLLACALNAYQMWDGGNQWSGWPAYLSFFRHVAKLALDYSTWRHYEALAVLAGPRIMHAEFCMISERPEVLTVDEQHRPHSLTGPFCRWRDGSALYSVHGVRVPAYVIERPHSITIADIEAERNAEVRRAMVDRYGLARYVKDARFDVLDVDIDQLGQPRRLLRKATSSASES